MIKSYCVRLAKGGFCIHSYETEKDLKKAKDDIDRLLTVLSNMSMENLIKTLLPYRETEK